VTRPGCGKEPALADLAEGCRLALENADRLLATAGLLVESNAATATYLVAIACEEMGKAAILAARWRVLDCERDCRESLAEEPAATPDVQETVNVRWDRFYRQAFCQHSDKTAAFYQVYGHVQGNHHRAEVIDEHTVAEVDPIGGLKDKNGQAVKALRRFLEGSLYVDWDGRTGRRLAPRAMDNVADFRKAVANQMLRFRALLPSERRVSGLPNATVVWYAHTPPDPGGIAWNA